MLLFKKKPLQAASTLHDYYLELRRIRREKLAEHKELTAKIERFMARYEKEKKHAGEVLSYIHEVKVIVLNLSRKEHRNDAEEEKYIEYQGRLGILDEGYNSKQQTLYKAKMIGDGMYQTAVAQEMHIKRIDACLLSLEKDMMALV